LETTTMQTTTTHATGGAYPRLPELTPQTPDETAEAYGLRALRFMLATDTTAGVPDEALALAGHTYRVAIAAPDLQPATLDRLAELERRIAAALRFRRRMAAEDARMAQDAPAGRTKPDAGPMAPNAPQPRQQPPNGQLTQPAQPQPQPKAQPTAVPTAQPLARADFAF
jgi:hypothetical protein